MGEEGVEVESLSPNGKTAVSNDTASGAVSNAGTLEKNDMVDDKRDETKQDVSMNESPSEVIESLKERSKILIEKTRRIMFTDAAVAIALTLLILPLMDAAVEAQDEEVSTHEWFQENKQLLLTFFLSYTVIAMAWIDHDRLFRFVSHFNMILNILNFVWLMAIAFIPAATNIMNSVKDDILTHFVWIGTFLFAKVITFAMTIVVRKNPEMWADGGPPFPLLVGSMVSICLLTIALLLSMTKAGYWMLTIVVLKIPITRMILWRWPSLRTKWETTSDDRREKNETLDNDITESSNKSKEDNKEGLQSLLRYLLALEDRLDGLMEAERRIIFTDAAAAIALTLLVLPLMDAATEARGEEISTAEWFQENRKLLLSFFLSYLVISLSWNDQDKLFRNVGAFTRLLSTLNFLWLLAIVFIPVATAILNLVRDDPLQHLVYIGTPMLAKIWTIFEIIEVHRNPGTWEYGVGPSFRLLLNGVVGLVLMVAALLLSFTAAGYLMLLILILTKPIVKAILWKWPGLEMKW